MTKRVDTPSISADLTDEESQAQFRESVKECVEVLEGKRGDGLDRALTARDLSEAGLIEVRAAVSSNGGSNSGIGIVAPVPTVSFPTTPTNLVISGAFTNLLLVWDAATFQGYAHTEVWRADTDSLPAAVKIATSSYHMFSDPVEPNSSFFYWVRFANTANQKGAYNAVNGTAGTTDKKVSTLLSELNDHIPANVLILDDGTVAGKAPFITVYGDGMAIGQDGTRYTNKTLAWKESGGGTTPPTINISFGKWFAAGTYIESAMIADASIDVAKINNLTVDFANVTGVLTANQIEAIQLDASNIDINHYLDFTSTTSGVRFQKTTLADKQAGAFYGREGSVAGFRVGGSTGGIYADSTGLVELNNVRLYSGGPGTPVEFFQVGTVLTQGISSTGTVTILVVGGGAGAPNSGLPQVNGYIYPNNPTPGGAGTASWLEFRNSSGTRVGTRYTAAGGASSAITHRPNNQYYNGVSGQASSQPNSAGAGGTPTPGDGYRGGGGGSPGGGYQTYSSTAAVTTVANAGSTISQQVTVPTGATQIAVYLGSGGAGGHFYYPGSPNGNQGVVSSTDGGDGGDGYVTYADPESGGIEIDLTSILTRLNALEGA